MAGGVVLVGAGVAAVSAARSLRASGYNGPVCLVGREDCVPYDRPPLSKEYLTGGISSEEIALLRPDELDTLRLGLRPGRAAVGLRPGEVVLEDGTALGYDALLVATGARPRRLPSAPGVHYLRTRADAAALAAALRRGRRLMVIGAGFIGLEVAASARGLGLDVTVLETAPAPLTRVLGVGPGERLASLHRERGVALHCGVGGIAFAPGVVRWASDDGPMESAADVVVAGIGAEPDVEWLAGSGVAVADGVVCDDGGRTSVAGVYAAGDAGRWRNALTGSSARVEQWQTAVEQGTIAGANIAADLGVAGAAVRLWSSVPYFWSDQFGHKVQFCGAPGPVSAEAGSVVGYAAHGVLTGVLTVDAPAVLARGRRLVARRTPWDEAWAVLTRRPSESDAVT